MVGEKKGTQAVAINREETTRVVKIEVRQSEEFPDGSECEIDCGKVPKRERAWQAMSLRQNSISILFISKCRTPFKASNFNRLQKQNNLRSQIFSLLTRSSLNQLYTYWQSIKMVWSKPPWTTNTEYRILHWSHIAQCCLVSIAFILSIVKLSSGANRLNVWILVVVGFFSGFHSFRQHRPRLIDNHMNLVSQVADYPCLRDRHWPNPEISEMVEYQGN